MVLKRYFFLQTTQITKKGCPKTPTCCNKACDGEEESSEEHQDDVEAESLCRSSKESCPEGFQLIELDYYRSFTVSVPILTPYKWQLEYFFYSNTII